MSSASYKLFLVDLDGTLISSDSKISPRVSRAVARVRGILHVAIATGRERADVIRFARELGLSTPQLSDGGAMILDPLVGTAIWSSPLGPARAREIIDRLGGLEVPFIATHPQGTFTSIAEITHWDVIRISALDLDQRMADQLIADYEGEPGVDAVKAYLPYNGLWAVDFTRSGVNKAAAARTLAEMMGVETSQLIAAGDSYNDLPLLQACGLRIAMADAPDELKAIADFIAPTADEDGLAIAIEEFVLPRLEKGG